MECPKCHNSLQHTAATDLNVRKCQGCGGLLLKDGTFEIARALKEVDQIDQAGDHNLNSLRDIDCPECASKMLRMVDRTQHHIEFEMCSKCDNVFLDAGELTDLTEFTLAERIKQALETAKTNLKRS